MSQFPKFTLTTRFTLSFISWLTYSGLQYLNWGFRFMYISLRYEVLLGESRGNGGVERWRERKGFNPKKSWSQLILLAALERVWYGPTTPNWTRISNTRTSRCELRELRGNGPQSTSSCLSVGRGAHCQGKVTGDTKAFRARSRSGHDETDILSKDVRTEFQSIRHTLVWHNSFCAFWNILRRDLLSLLHCKRSPLQRSSHLLFYGLIRTDRSLQSPNTVTEDVFKQDNFHNTHRTFISIPHKTSGILISTRSHRICNL